MTTHSKEIELEPSWKKALNNILTSEKYIVLIQNIQKLYLSTSVYPNQSNLFNAFTLCPFDKVKVVILGQDPYHGIAQAHGLAFSVPDNIPIPPSLKNIFQEIKNDIGNLNCTNGNLTKWADQGVLLLNSILTVEANKAASHQKIGWQYFTDAVIQIISDKKENIVFLLWGNYAKSKIGLIDSNKHCILTSVHPSPLSAHNGFLGCKHFSKTNTYLTRHNIANIVW